jgi:secretion/DNA translocation related TadE-like protein
MTRRAPAGSATVIVVALVALAAILAAGVGRLGAVASAAARARTAADAAALAAAAGRAEGRNPGEAARIAERAAAGNGARLAACDCGGPVISITVRVPLLRLPSFPREIRARARAEITADCPG